MVAPALTRKAVSAASRRIQRWHPMIDTIQFFRFSPRQGSSRIELRASLMTANPKEKPGCAESDQYLDQRPNEAMRSD